MRGGRSKHAKSDTCTEAAAPALKPRSGVRRQPLAAFTVEKIEQPVRIQVPLILVI